MSVEPTCSAQGRAHRFRNPVDPSPRRSRWYFAAKRLFDIVGAVTALIIAMPLFAMVAVAIVADSRGPIFYRAIRVGRHGRPLRMLKFRKMHVNAHGGPLTTARDSRFTRVGRFLTRTRLDELPQLWHVLRGDMSFVGPRPESPEFVATRPAQFAEILTMRPGIAGFSQLAYADEVKILSLEDPVRQYIERILPEKCALDRLYARTASVGADSRILIWTLVTVLLRRPVAVDRATGTLRLRVRPGMAILVGRASADSPST